MSIDEESEYSYYWTKPERDPSLGLVLLCFAGALLCFVAGTIRWKCGGSGG